MGFRCGHRRTSRSGGWAPAEPLILSKPAPRPAIGVGQLLDLVRIGSSLLAAFFVGQLAGCGGGGGGASFGVLWIPTDVVVADVDGDGALDVLTLAVYVDRNGDREGRLLYYRQTAPGEFSAPTTIVLGQFPWRMALGDIDGDDAPDLVVTDTDAQETYWVQQSSSHRGQFLAPVALTAGLVGYEAAIADLNDDGAPDVAIADAAAGSSRVVVYYQDPNNRGSFATEVEVTLAGRPLNIVAGDVDDDGLPDLLIWIYTSPAAVYPPTGALVVAYQKAGGGFDVSSELAPRTGLNVGRLAIEDANGNGRRDLLVFHTPFSASYTAQLAVVVQTSARAFDPAVTTPLVGVRGIDGAVLADLDDDDLPDSAVVGFFAVGTPSTVQSRANLLHNDGTGAFVLAAQIEMPIAVSRVAAGDLDGDDRNDLVLLGEENQCLVAFQSRTTPGTFSAPRMLH